jgi:hypothetical protein
MTGQFIVCEIKSHNPIEGADRIVSSDIFGETVIISKDVAVGTRGIFIDTESQLSEELCSKLNLYRHSELNEDKTVKGYIEDNRRVRPITLKGVRCSGLFLSLTQLHNLNIHTLPDVGTQQNKLNGITICNKYVTERTRTTKNKSNEPKIADNVLYFRQHMETDQWGRNSHKLQKDDLVTITEKLHGTSIRVGYLPVFRNKPWYKRLLNLFIDTVDYTYDFVVGSRRVIKSVGTEERLEKMHYYGHDLWSTVAKRELEDKLYKGETVYGEIVGFDLEGKPIMGSHFNEKLKNFMSKDEYKDFIKRYGDITEFSYGCSVWNTITKEEADEKGIVSDLTNGFTYRYLSNDNLNKLYIYRITMTTEDGKSIDLSWEQVKQRCEQLGVSHVPELYKGLVLGIDTKISQIFLHGSNTDLVELVNYYTESDSKHFPQHLNEGVCVRIENGSTTPQIYKSKRYIFKVIEGIIKDSDVADVEESN